MIKNIIRVVPFAILLSSCGSVMQEYGLGDPVSPLTQKEKMKLSARNALLEEKYSYIEKGALSDAEKAYRLSPKDKVTAYNYAHLLRRVKMLDEAMMVLDPFVKEGAFENEDIVLEYAKLQLERGDFYSAQQYAQKAVDLNDTAKARMVLGVAVDAQGYHKAAEVHLRDALEKADLNIGLKDVIKNNLALCLLAQNQNAEAKILLESIKSHMDRTDEDVVQANKELSEKL